MLSRPETASCIWRHGVLVVAHDTKAARNEAKASGEPGAGAVAGSAQWFDAARGVLYLHADPHVADCRIVECIKANHGRRGWGARLREVTGKDGRFSGFEENQAILAIS